MGIEKLISNFLQQQKGGSALPFCLLPHIISLPHHVRLSSFCVKDLLKKNVKTLAEHNECIHWRQEEKQSTQLLKSSFTANCL